jgi:hypothetical protein
MEIQLDQPDNNIQVDQILHPASGANLGFAAFATNALSCREGLIGWNLRVS